MATGQERILPLRYNVTGKTDVGLVRSGNEDYLHLDEANAVFAVCDGMGGHQAGEVASMSAADTMLTVFTHLKKELLADPDLVLDESMPPSGELLVKSIRMANREVYNRSLTDPLLTGMGTTVVAVALEGDVMSVAHVGDSRAYRLEERQLTPLTLDHSWVSEMREKQLISDEEALNAVGKNVITRALGVRETVEVDYRLVKVRAGDMYILCSDGLCGFADDDEIFTVADRARSDIKRVADDLVQMANDRGGADNVTVIVLHILEPGESNHAERDVQTFPAESPDLLKAEDAWLERLRNYRVEDKPPPDADTSTKGASRFLLTLIFVVFAIVAVAMVYLSTTGH